MIRGDWRVSRRSGRLVLIASSAVIDDNGECLAGRQRANRVVRRSFEEGWSVERLGRREDRLRASGDRRAHLDVFLVTRSLLVLLLILLCRVCSDGFDR